MCSALTAGLTSLARHAARRENKKKVCVCVRVYSRACARLLRKGVYISSKMKLLLFLVKEEFTYAQIIAIDQ